MRWGRGARLEEKKRKGKKEDKPDQRDGQGIAQRGQNIAGGAGAAA